MVRRRVPNDSREMCCTYLSLFKFIGLIIFYIHMQLQREGGAMTPQRF